MLPVTIWMNIPSHHQENLFRALAATGKVDLRVIYSDDVSQNRKDMGWEVSPAGYQHQFLNPRAQLADALRQAWRHRRRVNIVNGIWSQPPMTVAALVLRLTGHPYFIYSEASDPFRSRSRAKRFVRAILAHLIARYSKAHLLAISHLSRDFYQAMGFDPARIYDFGYFREHPALADLAERRDPDLLKVIYVGRLIHLKGVDLLLEALGPLLAEYSQCRLVVVGDGPERPALERRVTELGCQERVSFMGTVPSSQVIQHIHQADLLVLPSRQLDGWGMVTNEAFSVGVPVVVSDMCGSADLIQPGVNGYVFPSGQTAALSAALRDFLAKSPAERRAMSDAARLTGDSIATEVVAPYLVSCLEHALAAEDTPKPVPPWVRAATPV